MAGYFKIWRDLFEKPIWLNSTPEQKVILITLIKMANWKDAKWEWKGKPYHCEPGEFITSYNSIIKDCGKGVTHQNVRTAIKRFENYEFLTYQVTVGEYGGIKVKLTNWDKYQNKTNTSINSSLTDCQHISNSLLTPIKEYKEIKEYKNISLLSEKLKKEDPLISKSTKFFISEFSNIFGSKPFLSFNDRVKINELSAQYDDFLELIPTAIQRLKNIEFKDIDFKPSASWLLKGNNFERVMNGEFEKSNNDVSSTIDEWVKGGK